jgi:serine/threonine-protein kinase
MGMSTGCDARSTAETMRFPLPVADDAAREPRSGDLIAGRYRLAAPIGRGGMATVYRARDDRLQRDVAVKISRRAADMPAPPLREELVTSALIHPNIVAIFDGGEIPAGEPGAGARFIVMEYVPGTTAQVIAPVAWQRAVDIVAQVCAGLEAAHVHGVVHCDVKPGNVLIDNDGRVRVVDFGVAATLESGPSEHVHGSPAYIAPERLRGAPPHPRMDVYGLGGLLAFLLTGRHLDRATPHVGLPPDCPRGLAAVIARAREADPTRRFADAAAFRRALLNAGGRPVTGEDRLLASTVGPARAVTPRPPASARGPSTRPGTARRMSPPEWLRTLARYPRASIVLVAVCLAIVLAAGALLVPLPFGDAPGSSPAVAAATMPDLRAQNLSAATEQLAQLGLTVARVEVIYVPGPRDHVVSQVPEPGAEIGDGDAIVLIVRGGR